MSPEESAWRADLVAAERDYRVSDALFRLHRDLFELETVALRSSRNQIRSVQLMVNGRYATAVAGAIVLASFLRPLANMTWTSSPIVVVYVVVVGLVLLWLWQIRAAGEMEVGLKELERDAGFVDLDDREEFVFEEVNAYVVRHRVIDSIAAILRSGPIDSLPGDEQARLKAKLKRYEEIQEDCEQHVRDFIQASAKLLAQGKRSTVDHDELLDWAGGIPGFNTARGPARQSPHVHEDMTEETEKSPQTKA